MCKKFIYLIQGRAKDVPQLASLINQDQADTLQLTFDEELSGSYYLPKCTWLEGRNYLLQQAKKRNQDYLYYIFLDDDLVFERGSFNIFEGCLLKYNPAIAHPFYYIDEYTYRDWWRKFLPNPEAASEFFFDQMFIAIHRDLIKDEIIVPYIEDFQHISWYSAGRYFDFMMNLFYADFPILRFNSCVVSNSLHDTSTRPQQDYLPALKIFLREGTICSDNIFEFCFNIEKHNKYIIENRNIILIKLFHVLKSTRLRKIFWLILSSVDWVKEIRNFDSIKKTVTQSNYSVFNQKYDLLVKDSLLDHSMKSRNTLTIDI